MARGRSTTRHRFDPDDPAWQTACLLRLEHAAQRLALPASDQAAQYPRWVAPAAADELALDFNHWLEVCEPILEDSQDGDGLALLRAIDDTLDSFSGLQNARRWTLDALAGDPVWERVREQARAALKHFGWPNIGSPTPEDAGDAFVR